MALESDCFAIGSEVVDQFLVGHAKVLTFFLAEAPVLLRLTLARHFVYVHLTLAVKFDWTSFIASMLKFDKLVHDGLQNFILNWSERSRVTGSTSFSLGQAIGANEVLAIYTLLWRDWKLQAS